MDHGFEDGSSTPFRGYGPSNTANIYMANEIENRYRAKGLHGHSLHPGDMWTGLQQHIPSEMLAQWKSRLSVDDIVKSNKQGVAI